MNSKYKIEGWMFYPFPDMRGSPLFSHSPYVSKKYGIEGRLVRLFGFIFWIVKLNEDAK
jgi:hypothetical protein